MDEKPEPTTQETTASELGPETQEDSKSEDPDQDEGEDHDDATGVEDDGDEEVSTQLETAAATAEFLKSVNTSVRRLRCLLLFFLFHIIIIIIFEFFFSFFCASSPLLSLHVFIVTRIDYPQMEARHKAKRQKLQDQHRAAVEKIEKDIRERSRRQAKELYV